MARKLTTFTAEFFLSTETGADLSCDIVWAALKVSGLVAKMVDSDHFTGMDAFGAIVFETADNETKIRAFLGLTGIKLGTEITLSTGNRLEVLRRETADADTYSE